MVFDVGDNKMTKEEAVFVLRGRRNQYKEMAEAVDMAIEALIQEPNSDAISRQAVLDIDFKRIILTIAKPTETIVQKVRALPPVTPQPKTGHWIKHSTGHSVYYDCSLCSCIAPFTETADNWLWKLSKYCPDCGAKMEVDK